jgi:hypothetical protein
MEFEILWIRVTHASISLDDFILTRFLLNLFLIFLSIRWFFNKLLFLTNSDLLIVTA